MEICNNFLVILSYKILNLLQTAVGISCMQKQIVIGQHKLVNDALLN